MRTRTLIKTKKKAFIICQNKHSNRAKIWSVSIQEVKLIFFFIFCISNFWVKNKCILFKCKYHYIYIINNNKTTTKQQQHSHKEKCPLETYLRSNEQWSFGSMVIANTFETTVSQDFYMHPTKTLRNDYFNMKGLLHRVCLPIILNMNIYNSPFFQWFTWSFWFVFKSLFSLGLVLIAWSLLKMDKDIRPMILKDFIYIRNWPYHVKRNMWLELENL